MSVIGWIVLGAVAGWLASILTGRNERMGCLANIVVGILGALIGGAIIGFLAGGGVDPISGFNISSLIVAVIGAVILLLVFGLFRGR
jgi:uncharacterized membrane protein YeaQ/YmgE (transglycosylase-associated protein family)